MGHSEPDDASGTVKRPKDVPPYVAEYNLRMLSLGIEPFRPASLLRNYAKDSRTPKASTWNVHKQCHGVRSQTLLRVDRTAATLVCLPASDVLMTSCNTCEIWTSRTIKDPRAFLLNNFYPDGNTSIALHQHDFWSAILSLGAPRVFTVDGDPVLLNDGDVIVIGTQRHSVPKMPEVKDGRVSVAIFWYPESRGPMCDRCGADAPLQESRDGLSYCQACWRDWQEEDHSDDAMLQVALQLSILEQ